MSVNDIRIQDTRLSLEEQLELGRRTAEGDKAAREKLVLSCVPLVKSFYKTPLCRYFSCYDDVFQDGMTGALEAVDSYNYKKQTAFTTFAYVYIHKRILKGIISRAPLKISDKDFFNTILLHSTVDSFYTAYMVFPTTEQLANLTGIPKNNVQLLLKRNIFGTTLTEDSATQEKLCLPREDTNLIIEKTLKKFLQEKIIEEALDTLTPFEKEIIQHRFLYKDCKTSLQELASAHNVSTVAIHKREKAAIKKLFAFFVKKNIAFDDVI